MCLEIIARISPDSKNQVSAKRASDVSGLHVSKIYDNGQPALHFSVTGGCSCDFLSDNSDWNDPIWNLEEEHLPGLAKAIHLIGESTDGFAFLVHWLDREDIADSQKVKLSKLIIDIEENQLQNNVLYIVGRQARTKTAR
jgi:hypothetical protein